MLELRHLRYFVAVAEEHNFSRAAERLHMAQSPLSAAIRQLEYEVGAELLSLAPASTGDEIPGMVAVPLTAPDAWLQTCLEWHEHTQTAASIRFRELAATAFGHAAELS